MVRRRHKAIIIGVAMVLLGLVQAGSYFVSSDWQFAVFGLLYAVIGIGYLWVEVYTVDR